MERRSAFAGLLALAAIATTVVAIWLLEVSVLVLPARDPGHVVEWRWIAVALLIYAGVSGARVIGIRHRLVRAAVLLLSVAAIGFGVYAIRSVFHSSHREGYLLLIGAALCLHALIAIGHEVSNPTPRTTARQA